MRRRIRTGRSRCSATNRHPSGAPAMNAACSSGVATTSIGKKEWKSFTDWMRVARARGREAMSECRHARRPGGIGGGGEVGRIRHRRVVSPGGRPRHVVDVVGGMPSLGLEDHVARGVLHARRERVRHRLSRVGVQHHDRLLLGVGVVPPPWNRHHHRVGHAVADECRIDLDDRAVVAPRRPLRAGGEPGRPVARLPGHAVHHVGERRRAVEARGVGRGLATGRDEAGAQQGGEDEGGSREVP